MQDNMRPSSAVSAKIMDAGLRAYMIRVYNFMSGGLFVSGLAAWLTYRAAVVENAAGDIMGLTAFGAAIYGGPVAFIIMFAPLIFVIALSFRVQRMAFSSAQMVFWAFAAVMGMSLSSIFVMYTQTSIIQVFMITGIMFASMSLYGYTTRKDLTSLGSFLFMGLVGIIIASIVNIFMGSPFMSFVISFLAVIIFTGLTAYDTQKIKHLYDARHSHETSGKIALMGALNLYLDFINIFIHLLRLIGERR